MASVVSTAPPSGAIRFAADFVANIPRYQQAIRRHRMMGWASERALDDDLVQLALLDLARVDVRYSEQRASSPHHFRLAVLKSRVSDCARALMRLHRDLTGDATPTLDDGENHDDAVEDELDHEHADGDPVFASVSRAQQAETLQAAIQTLPLRQREVMELVLLDLSDREIAERSGVTVQAVNKTRLAALATLKKIILTKFPVN